MIRADVLGPGNSYGRHAKAADGTLSHPQHDVDSPGVYQTETGGSQLSQAAGKPGLEHHRL
ncbi:MAG: hypothetical protein IPJ47_22760 [Anaerolineales bacterium]|nr:hypothetical protein [Anaerolineales bacterium]